MKRILILLIIIQSLLSIGLCIDDEPMDDEFSYLDDEFHPASERHEEPESGIENEERLDIEDGEIPHSSHVESKPEPEPEPERKESDKPEAHYKAVEQCIDEDEEPIDEKPPPKHHPLPEKPHYLPIESIPIKSESEAKPHKEPVKSHHDEPTIDEQEDEDLVDEEPKPILFTKLKEHIKLKPKSAELEPRPTHPVHVKQEYHSKPIEHKSKHYHPAKSVETEPKVYHTKIKLTTMSRQARQMTIDRDLAVRMFKFGQCIGTCIINRLGMGCKDMYKCSKNCLFDSAQVEEKVRTKRQTPFDDDYDYFENKSSPVERPVEERPRHVTEPPKQAVTTPGRTIETINLNQFLKFFSCTFWTLLSHPPITPIDLAKMIYNFFKNCVCHIKVPYFDWKLG